MLRHDLSRDYQSLFRGCLYGFDIAMVVLASVVAHYLRFGDGVFHYYYWSLLGLAVATSLIVFRWFGLYEPLREKRLFQYIFNGIVAIVLLFAILSVFSVMSKTSTHYSRIWLGYWLLVLLSSFVISRCCVYLLLSYLRRKGLNLKRVVIIGTNQRAQDLVAQLQRSLWAGVRPVLFFAESGFSEKKIANISVRPLVLSCLSKLVKRARIDEVWIVLPLSEEVLIRSVAQALVHDAVTVRYVPDFLGLSFRRHTMTEISGYPLINIYSSPMEGERRLLKAIEDRGLALVFLLIASPIMLLIAVLIKLTSTGPVFFRQQRHGLNGKKFSVYKFRSMIVHRENSGQVSQATKHDPRVTKIGRFLRSTSLDELPQLLNVLQGDMSIVGPRPHAVEHNEYYKDLVSSYMQRFRMKPGITGWAQVNGYRGETDTLEKMQRRVEHDLYYIENWTLAFDLRIIWLTLWRGFFHNNAY